MSIIATRSALLAILCVAPFAPAASAADASSHESHVRTVDRPLASLLREAAAASPSFRALVDRLDQSDVVAYVRFDYQPPSGLDGQLTFAGMGGGRRYVVVMLAWGRSDLRTMATLAHELQHAVEVSELTDIVDSPSLGRAYARIGRPSHSLRARVSYETDAAMAAGRRVWRELCHQDD